MTAKQTVFRMPMRRICTALSFLLSLTVYGSATQQSIHVKFLHSACRSSAQETLIVSDTTLAGEIDDSVSLMLYRQLEERGCINVIGIVSIFGNGRSSTSAVHRNLTRRLEDMNLGEWKTLLLRGPDSRTYRKLSRVDQDRLSEIARVINRYEKVVIAELGPMTVSAGLLMHEMVDPAKLEAVLGVGGRNQGERFTTERTFAARLFAFRDMNVDEDRKALSYLLNNYSEKLWMVTYRTGVGVRTAQPEAIASFAPALASHAEKRARVLRGTLGYSGIPLWDSWTTSYFIRGGAEALGCRRTRAALRYDEGGFRDPMQLWLDPPSGAAKTIIACHE